MGKDLSKEEIEELKVVLSEITTHIPNHRTHYIWSTYKVITGSKEPTPCQCGSSAGHWRKAVDSLRLYIDERK